MPREGEIDDLNQRVAMFVANTVDTSPPNPTKVRPRIITDQTPVCTARQKMSCPLMMLAAVASRIHRSPYRWTAKPEKKGRIVLGIQ